MKKYVDFIFKYKKILIIALVSLNLFALAGVFRISLNTDFSIFSSKDSEYEIRLNELEDIFGELNQIIVLVEHDEFNDNVVIDFADLQKDITEISSVNYVQGVAPESLSINGNDILIENIDAATLENYYNNFGDFSPITVVDETYYSSFIIFINDEFTDNDIATIESYLDNLDGDIYQSYISGDSYNQLKISSYIIIILLLLPPMTIFTIILVFRWQMRAFKPTFLSILPAFNASLWTFGLIGWLGNEVSILSAIVPIFIIVIGSADGLHFMSHYQDSKVEKSSDKESLVKTLKLVGIPMIVTTLTSMVGFISLLSMNTNSIVDLAVFSAVGIMFAGVATWFILPLILSGGMNVLPKKASQKHIDLSILFKKIWGAPTLFIILVILGASVFTYSNINNEFNMLMVYKDYTVVSKNADKIEEVNGGSIPLYVYINLEDAEDTLTVETLNTVKGYVAELNELDEVNKVINPFNLFDIAYQQIGTGEIVEDIFVQNIYDSVTEDPNNPIDNLISSEDGIIRLLVYPKDLSNDTLITIENSAKLLSDDISVTGVQYLMMDLNVNISDMQLKSISIALVVVFLMLVMTLRNIKVAFYSLLPIIITVISLYGFLGLSSIPLNITTVIIFSITIGVGIDYAVHFSSVFMYYLKELNDKNKAIEEAYKNTARPIITNALGISLGLSILMLSPLTIHFNVSVLMWVSMFVSVIITLTLLPLLFRISKFKIKRKG